MQEAERRLATGAAETAASWSEAVEEGGADPVNDRKRILGAYAVVEIMRRISNPAARLGTSLSHFVLSQLHAQGAQGALYKVLGALSVCGGVKATLTRRLGGGMIGGDFKRLFPLFGLVFLMFDNVGFQEMNKAARYVQFVHLLWGVVGFKTLLKAGIFAQSAEKREVEDITVGERVEDYQMLANRTGARIRACIQLSTCFEGVFDVDGMEIGGSATEVGTGVEAAGAGAVLPTTISNFDGTTTVTAVAEMEAELNPMEESELAARQNESTGRRKLTMYDDYQRTYHCLHSIQA